ncbi:hypothetical protein MRX96_058502 [Rhipicephalus microplus]
MCKFSASSTTRTTSCATEHSSGKFEEGRLFRPRSDSRRVSFLQQRVSVVQLETVSGSVTRVTLQPRSSGGGTLAADGGFHLGVAPHSRHWLAAQKSLTSCWRPFSLGVGAVWGTVGTCWSYKCSHSCTTFLENWPRLEA